MRFSVIGHKKIGVSCAWCLKKSGFDLIAFYSDDINECVKCAVQVNCKAYTSLKMLLDESELIILAADDIELKSLMRKIAVFNVENKIFLSLSYAQTSDAINIGSKNTYFSCFIPKAIKKDDITDLSDVCLLFEGQGKDYWDLYDELYMRKVNFKMVDKTKKYSYNIASALVSDLIFTFCRLADDVLKNADGDMKNVESFAHNAISELFDENNNVEKADFGSVINNLSLINYNSAKKIEAIYKVLEVISNGI